ncbi:NAD(P)/FAD-dependent oxidoreductase [Carnimonas bestiolae]|uniref:NAD(P)/FAD-dependent oxidoreductase n=1 Tax=Carnimonas bestiolae TaxID=3402172 RepID=UPI003EDBDA8D
MPGPAVTSTLGQCDPTWAAPTGSTHQDADIAVVGAGVIGCAAALRFAQQGLKVQLVDAAPIGMGASYGNAGHIATEQVFPPADPAILRKLPAMLVNPKGPLRLDWRYLPRITPWLCKLLANMRPGPFQHSTRALRALNEHSLAAWQGLLSSIGEQALLECRGNLSVYEQPQSRKSADALRNRMAEQGVAVEHLSRAELFEREPHLTQRLMGGLEFKNTAHVVDPYRIVMALARAAQYLGARFTQCRVTDASLNAEGVELVTTTGPIKARRVLIACGAHSAELVQKLSGQRPPLDTERGYHLMLPHEVGRLRMPVNSLERSFIMTPMAEGLRLAGTVEFAGLKRPPRMARAWGLATQGNALFDTPLDTRDAEPWMGFRPSLPDALPVINRLAEGRLLLAFGHQHLGLTQAALTADILSSLITDGSATAMHYRAGSSRPIDLHPYRLARFI